MGRQIGKSIGFCNRLRHDAAGNTLAMVAAAMIPLAGLVGGGIDISRLYLTQTRLQQACDAGALAGRRSMSGLTWATANEETANNFFHTNFPNGKYGAGDPNITYTATNAGAVNGAATISVPMTLMKLFAVPNKTISANCTADLQLPNTDVMFVLDTTLSMNDINPGDTLSRIAVLRTAVADFYNTLENVKPIGATIRYGFVPYSSTVNVGMLLRRNWIQDNPVYDSRVPDGWSPKEGGTQGDTINQNDAFSTNPPGTPYQGSSEKCVAPASTLSDKSTYTAWTPSNTAVPRERDRTRTRNGTSYSAKLTNGVCWITPTTYDNLVETRKERVIVNPKAGQENADGYYYHWIYRPVVYPSADLKGVGDGNALVSGGSFTASVTNDFGKNDIPGNTKPVAPRTVPWNVANGACIEERATRRSDENASVPRHDMDVDLIPDPTRPETQWKPYLPQVVYGRASSSKTATTGWVYSGSAETSTRLVNINATLNYLTPNGDTTEYGACPTAARQLAAIDSATLTTYLAALRPAGYTYHDIGLLWGLRLMSREGLFAAEHAAAEANGRFARHLIFMTDGETDTRIQAYDAWGLSAVARRRTPTGTIPTNAGQNAITEARLSELCTIAKNNKNITLWVIAFGTDLTTLLSNCASPGRAYQADNSAQLTETFAQIASQIAQLRITR